MAKTINPIDTTTETFQNWITRTNDVIAALKDEVVTANASAGVTGGNVYVTGTISSATVLAANTIRGGNVTSTSSLTIGSNVSMANTTNILIGNATVNATLSSSLIKVSNSTSTVNVTPVDLKVGISVVNGTQVSVGANSFINATHVSSNIVFGDQVSATLSIANTMRGGNTSTTLPVNFTANISMTNTVAIIIGNSTVNSVSTSALLKFEDTAGSLNVSATSVQAGVSKINATHVAVGANTFMNATHVSTNNLFADSANTTVLTSGISQVNTTHIAVGANSYMNATHIRANNISVDVITATTYNYESAMVSQIFSVSNTSFTANLIPTGLVTANVNVGANAITIGSNVTINTTAIAITVGSSPTINSTAFKVGNTTVNNTGTYLTSGAVSSINVQTSGTSQQVVDSATLSSTRSMEYMWSMTDNNANAYQTSKLSVIHAGGASYHTEYAVLFSNTQLGTFATDTNTTHVRVLFTPTASNVQLKAVRTTVNV